MATDELRKQAEFESTIRLAHISRKRGDYGQASKLVVQALSLNPDDLEARELAADIFYARGELEKAADIYKAIIEADPSRTTAEEKFAKATLDIAEGKRQQDLIKYMLEHPEVKVPAAKNPVVSAMFSGIPGLGHVYCCQTIKGIVLFVSTTLCWLFFFALRPDVSFYPPEQRITMFTRNIDPAAVLFLCLAVALHLYTLVNAAMAAEKLANEAKKTTEP